MLACVLAMSGCVSGPAIDYMKAEYTGVPVKLHTTAVDEYRIFDKPEAGKLMITPSLAAATGMGVVHGATYGAVDQSHFTKPWSDAAADYLASTGRTCRIVSTELLARPQYEVKYDCSAPAPATRRRG
jgi:hypothetical protein